MVMVAVSVSGRFRNFSVGLRKLVQHPTYLGLFETFHQVLPFFFGGRENMTSCLLSHSKTFHEAPFLPSKKNRKKNKR